jgi:capsular exopolysaccharide synthesis family protein
VNEGSQDATLRDYVHVVWRRKWIVVGLTFVLLALALGYSFAKTPLYSASAQLIYEDQINVADPLGSTGSIDTSQLELALDSVASIIASPDLVNKAEDIMGGKTDTYTVEAAPDGSTTNTVSITAVSPSATTAEKAANAYAEAYVAYRKESALERVRKAIQVIQGRLDTMTSTADQQSSDFVTLQQRLQDLQILEETVNGNFRVLIPATVPSAPYTPKPVRNGLVGAIAGFVLGIVIVLLLEQFDTRVRTTDRAVEILGIPLLGTIHKLTPKAMSSKPLFVLSDTRGPAAEAIRKVRGGLEFANVDGDLTSLVVSSCLQHEGKTVTTCNLALALAATGMRVILVDGDLRRPQVHRYLGLQNSSGVSTVLTGKSQLSTTIRTHSAGMTIGGVSVRETKAEAGIRTETLHVLTSGPVPPNPAEVVASRSFSSLIDELGQQFDLVIVDSPALLAVGDSAAIARSVDGIIFLVDLTRARTPLLSEAATQLQRMPCRKLGLVALASVPSRQYERDHYTYYAHEVAPETARVLKRPAQS